MYNDYYLEQINNKMSTTNNALAEILEIQEDIKTNQETLISGDNRIIEQNNTKISLLAGIELILMLIIIYRIIERMLKG